MSRLPRSGAAAAGPGAGSPRRSASPRPGPRRGAQRGGGRGGRAAAAAPIAAAASAAAVRQHHSVTVGFHDVPPHFQYNVFIHKGYRPSGLTPLQCVASMFSTVHNETWNVLTHAIPLVMAVMFLVSNDWHARPAQYALYGAQVMGIVLVLAGSSTYHMMMPACTTQKAYDRLLLADALCIWVLQFSIVCGVVHYGFVCAPPGVKALAAVPFPLLALYLLISARTARDRMVATGVLCLARYVAYALRPFIGHNSAAPLVYYLLGEALMFVGGYINVRRLPERYSPGRFDIGLNSHQLFHVLTAAAMACVCVAAASDCAYLELSAELQQCADEPLVRLEQWALQ